MKYFLDKERVFLRKDNSGKYYELIGPIICIVPEENIFTSMKIDIKNTFKDDTIILTLNIDDDYEKTKQSFRQKFIGKDILDENVINDIKKYLEDLFPNKRIELELENF